MLINFQHHKMTLLLKGERKCVDVNYNNDEDTTMKVLL